MRIVIQRVIEASVFINESEKRTIGKGLLLLCGIEDGDAQDDVEWLSQKIVQMRIFSDAEDKMNLSLKDIDGEILLISQFTLHASTKKKAIVHHLLKLQDRKRQFRSMKK